MHARVERNDYPEKDVELHSCKFPLKPFWDKKSTIPYKTLFSGLAVLITMAWYSHPLIPKVVQ